MKIIIWMGCLIIFPSAFLSAQVKVTAPDSIESLNETVSKNAVFPIMFYSDETSLAAGVMDQYFRQPYYSNKASALLIYGFYTLNRQYLFQIQPELYFRNDLWKIAGEMEYAYWPTTHFGIGNNISKSLSEDYTKKEIRIDLALEKKMSPSLYLGLKYIFDRLSLSDLKPGGLLERNRPSGIEEGNISGLGLSASWDSRDNNINPRNGSYHQFSLMLHSADLGSDYEYRSYKFDLRFYFPVFHTNVLAIQNVLMSNRKDVPFQMMKSVGDLLRGYEENRFKGPSLHTIQLEFRMPLFWRFGLVGFSGAGQVASEIRGFRYDRYHTAYGFGFRFALIPEKTLNARLDVGFGENDMTIDMKLLEAF